MSELDKLIQRIIAAAENDTTPYPAEGRPRVGIGTHDYTVHAFLFGIDFDRYFSDPQYYVTETLKMKLWRHEAIHDDYLTTADLSASLGYYPEYTYMGMTASVDAQGVAILQNNHPLTRDPDLRYLAPVDFYTSGWMPRVLRWYDDISELVGGQIPVGFGMAWWRGPLDLAIQLRGYEALMEDISERPVFVHDLLRFITEQRCRWYERYYRHFELEPSPGPIGDDWLNVPFISPDFFVEFVLPCYLEIERFHGGIAWVHSCGNQGPLQPHMLKLDSLQSFEISPWTDMHETLRNVPPDKRLGFDLHPTEVLLDPPETAREKLQAIKHACAGRQYSVQGGGALISTPKDYLRRLLRWLEIAYEIFCG